MKVYRASRDVLLPMLIAFSCAIIAKAVFFDVMIAEGQSMEPRIPAGTVILVNRLAYGLRLPFASRYLIRWAEPMADDILVFLAPDGRYAVKRCILSWRDQSPLYDTPSEGFILVHGDNSVVSWDSRSYGPVSIEAVHGRLVGFR